jgi:hypothetical protein
MFQENQMTAVRIKKYKIGKRGKRGLTITLPTIQCENLQVSAGDNISLYSGDIEGLPIIILANSDYPVLRSSGRIEL